jgi:hypothetical protein
LNDLRGSLIQARSKCYWIKWQKLRKRESKNSQKQKTQRTRLELAIFAKPAKQASPESNALPLGHRNVIPKF